MQQLLIINARALDLEFAWFAKVLQLRLALHQGQPAEATDVLAIPPPEHEPGSGVYADMVHHYKFTPAERLVLMLTLAPHVKPALLDVFFTGNPQLDRGYTEFGGIKAIHHGGFLPTGETALFLLAGENLVQRFHFQQLFDGQHYFNRHNILSLEPANGEEPEMAGQLKMSHEFIHFITSGQVKKPNFNSKFPARLLETNLEWDDLVLSGKTLHQLEEIKIWVMHGHKLFQQWDMKAKIRRGYRSLFYGPPGTGKTMTACLLGKATGRDVYKIDLSLVVSKYIGETERNLSRIFDQAESKDWILFFDEADALFGKRTQIEDAHDRYANQEVSFLLQRIEDYDGVVILASNFKTNMDDAFTRRFESIIEFTMPSAEQRLAIWNKGFSRHSQLEENIDLQKISRQYELSGGAIMNVVRHASLMALHRNSNVLSGEELQEGIRKEYSKEGRTF